MSNTTLTTATVIIETMDGDTELNITTGQTICVGDGRTNKVFNVVVTKINATRITVENGDSYAIKTGKRTGDQGSYFPMRIISVKA